MKSRLKKQSFDYELIAMSYHEAGHVVCGLYNYLWVCDANVMTPKKREGGTMYYTYGCFEEFNDNIVEDEELRKILFIFELQALYAGLIAEKMYYKDICGSSKFPNHLKNGSSYDTTRASNIIRKNKLVSPGKQTFLFKKQVRYDVEQMLNEHWDAVKVIAHFLYQKKRLTFDELKYNLTRRTEHREFWKDKFKKIKLIHNDKNPPAEDFVKELMLEDTIFSI